jgi:hypothetical protein
VVRLDADSAAPLAPEGLLDRLARRADPETLCRLGLPFHPLTSRYRRPDERTLRDAYAQVDAAALRDIGAKTNEIPEFVPLLEQIDDADLTDCVITVDALRAQKAHATYLVEQRGAHYLLSVKNNQPTLARQLRKLP